MGGSASHRAKNTGAEDSGGRITLVKGYMIFYWVIETEVSWRHLNVLPEG